jgi:ribosome biogenesis protein Nip4
MKTKTIITFALRFAVHIGLNEDFIVEKNGRFYLVSSLLRPYVHPDFFYAGLFLGKAKKGKFFPSFNLLSMLAKENANKVIIDKKAAWLYICGRDVLGKSILRFHGSGKKNTDVLVLNEFGECLGFGRIVGRLSGEIENNEIAVRNISDVGDFLRRERY